jgi:hypothetical protein
MGNMDGPALGSCHQPQSATRFYGHQDRYAGQAGGKMAYPLLASGSPTTSTTGVDRRAYHFDLPEDRVAQEPPEARGLARSDVSS